jgi:hypothetical protein
MGCQTYEQRARYIRNFARTLMGQLGIKPADYEGSLWGENAHEASEEFCTSRIARRVNKSYFGPIFEKLENASDEVVGKVAMCAPGTPEPGVRVGIADLRDALNLERVNLKLGGRSLILYIAAGSLIAAITDNILFDLTRR